MYNQNTRAFVTCSNKSMHVWSELSGEQLFKSVLVEDTKSSRISTFGYCHKSMLYFVFSTDFKMHVFNESLIHVTTLNTQLSVVRDAILRDE